VRADGLACEDGFTLCSGLTFKLINVNAAIISLQPTKPELVAPAEDVMTLTKPTLSWTAQRANQYRLFLDTVNPPVATPIIVNTTSYPRRTPLDKTVYYGQVQALNSLGGVSVPSDIHSFTVDVPPVRNFTTDTTPTFMWTPITWATSYELQIATNSAFTTGG